MLEKSVKRLPIIAFIFLFTMTGCFALPVEEPVLPPPVIRPFEPDEYVTTNVTRGDISRYRSLSVHIVPVQEEILAFSVPDIYIHAIHVNVGDDVRAGDIVAELDREGFERALYLAQREVTAANIDINHLDEREPLYYTEAFVRGDAIDADRFTEERGNLQAERNIRQLAAEHLQLEDDRRVLRAHIDGTVTHTIAFRPGDVSVPGARVVTIADETEQIFTVTGTDAQHLIPGDVHTVSVNREPISAIVLPPDIRGEVEDDRAFLAAYGGEALHFPDRAFATMQLVLEEIEDVLFVPNAAVHTIEEREFVFILNEDGLRVIQDVTIGLVGNHGTEIIGGLSEGDVIVIP